MAAAFDYETRFDNMTDLVYQRGLLQYVEEQLDDMSPEDIARLEEEIGVQILID